MATKGWYKAVSGAGLLGVRPPAAAPVGRAYDGPAGWPAMAFEATGLLRLGHILFASLWFGGAAYQVLVIGPTLRQSGPAAGGFMKTLADRGGIGRFFAITGGLAILFGAGIYGVRMGEEALETFSGPGLWLTLGALVAVAAYLHGMVVNMPTERRWLAFMRELKGPPTKEQGARMQEFGMKLGKAGVLSFVMIAVAMLLMLLSRVFV